MYRFPLDDVVSSSSAPAVGPIVGGIKFCSSQYSVHIDNTGELGGTKLCYYHNSRY